MLAASASNFPLLHSILVEIINPIVGLLFAIALVYFLWGVFEFLQGPSNEDKLKAARNKMLYGILGLFLMVSAVGVVNLICNTLQC